MIQTPQLKANTVIAPAVMHALTFSRFEVGLSLVFLPNGFALGRYSVATSKECGMVSQNCLVHHGQYCCRSTNSRIEKHGSGPTRDDRRARYDGFWRNSTGNHWAC